MQWRGRWVTSAIWKEPVQGAIRLEGVNLAGDAQADRRVHGGPDKAVYAYAAEDHRWWAATLRRLEPLEPGAFGENLTTAAIDLNRSRIGDRWHVGSAVLEVAQPRVPCFKLGVRMDDESFPGRFTAAGRPGAYLRIVAPGWVTAGDRIEVEQAEPPAVAIGSLVEPLVSDETLRRAAADPRVPDGWRRAATRRLSS